jgi:hypothetical protein
LTTNEPPTSAAEALAAAAQHTRAAVSEAIAAIHSLLDAVSLASAGELSEAHQLLGPITQTLENLRGQLGDDRESAHLLAAIADALDAEIERWQQRAREDPDARSVLRAFIGLRELLWEFGVRPSSPDAERQTPPTRRGVRKSTPKRRKAVQRINVEG